MSHPSDKAQEFFFTLLQAGLHPDYTPESVPATSGSVWEEVYRTASEQGVAGIVWDGLQRLLKDGAIPPEAAPARSLKLQWALNVDRIERLYEKQHRVIVRLAGFLHEHGIPLMVIKGYGLSRSYPHPEHRPCGDIDIWLYGRQKEADELLRRAWNVEIDADVHHHTTFVLDGVLVENHFDFLNIHAHLSNRNVERLLQRYAQEPGGEVLVGNAPVRLPSANFNALFLLRHAAMHFAAQEIGMRHVVDWAVFVEHDRDRIDWTALYAVARKMNMHRFLNSLNALAVDRLGMDAALVPPFEREPVLERRVLGDILHPEFSEQAPRHGMARIIWFRTRRWWANRWKHRIVYKESLLLTFLVQVRSHLMKPKTVIH